MSAKRGVRTNNDRPPIWYPDRPPIMNKRPCGYEEDGIRTWRVSVETPMLANHLRKVDQSRSANYLQSGSDGFYLCVAALLAN